MSFITPDSLRYPPLAVTVFAADEEEDDGTESKQAGIDEARDRNWNTSGDTLEISSAGEMAQFCYLANLMDTDPDYVDFSGKTISLADDIDLSEIEWLGVFLDEDVIFEGNGHTVTVDIYNFENGYEDSNSVATYGLFSQTMPGSVVRNLHVDGKITRDSSPNMVALGIAGVALGKLENCVSSLEITFSVAGGNAFLGGISGLVSISTEITDCVFDGEILITENIGGSAVGGIAGYANQGSAVISNCENRGTISFSSINTTGIGGILGESADVERIDIINCLFDGEIKCISSGETPSFLGTNHISGIIGQNSLYATPSIVNIENCLVSGSLPDELSDESSVLLGAFLGGTGANSNSSPDEIITNIINSYYTESAGEGIDIAPEIDKFINIDNKSEQVEKIDQDLADRLNDGKDENYWQITDDGITCLIPEEEPDEPDEPDDDSRRPGHSYSLEEREPDDKEEEQPEQPEEPEETEITDIIGHWAKAYINSALDAGYMDVVTPTQFFPDSPATRLTVAEALHRLSGSPDDNSPNPFTDTTALSAVWLYNRGIVSGFGDNTFRPNDTVTREQLAVFIYNYMASLGMDVSDNNGMDVYKFSDYEDISDWAFTAVRYCVENGILNGNTNGTFNPKGSVSRAELAVILNNLSQI